MNIFVCGSGVIGSLLIHHLVAAGNNVSVLARGQRLRELQEHGLRIKTSSKSEITTDQVTALDAIPADTHYDVIFSAMQYSQQWELLDALGRAACETIVLIGNNAQAERMEAHLRLGAAQAHA